MQAFSRKPAKTRVFDAGNVYQVLAFGFCKSGTKISDGRPASCPSYCAAFSSCRHRAVFHHALHLLELRQHTVHFLICTPAPVAMRRLREALISSGLARSSWRHGIDNAFHTANLLFSHIHVRAVGGLLHLRRQFIHQTGQTAHVFIWRSAF
jgi:hypothetical protein